MSDRHSQRIREHFKRNPNPRARQAVEQRSLTEQMRRVYQPAPAPSTADPHAQLARQIGGRRSGRG